MRRSRGDYVYGPRTPIWWAHWPAAEVVGNVSRGGVGGSGGDSLLWVANRVPHDRTRCLSLPARERGPRLPPAGGSPVVPHLLAPYRALEAIRRDRRMRDL